MAVKIALAGNPNCGKTTLFNALTGSNQFVGNWPGVTVEKKEGKLKGHKDVTIMDLPGIYSLSPYTLEEVVARNYLIGERPDAIINIVDGTNIERNLYLSTQIMELGIPVIMAVNMVDILEKTGEKVHIDKLSQKLGCEVVEISALKGTGITKAAEKAVALAQQKGVVTPVHEFSKEVEDVIHEVEAKLGSSVDKAQKRSFAIKLLERDDKIGEQMKPQAIKRIQTRLVLEKIAEVENIQPTEEEVEEEFKKMADAYKMEVEKIKELLGDRELEQMKKDMVTEIAATLAFSAIQNNDKIGVIFFSDRIEKFIPPKKGRKHILYIIRELLDFRPESRRTNIRLGLEYLTNVMKRRCTAFVLSDFIDQESFKNAMTIANRKHDVVAIQVYDRRVEELPAVGLMKIKDAETGHEQWIDTSSRAVRRAHRDWWVNKQTELNDTFTKSNVDNVSVRTDQDYVKALMNLFAKRS